MKHILFILIFFLSYESFAQDTDYNEDKVLKAFADVKAICNKDNASLWGKDLWGPILVIDRNSRTVFANQQDSAGILMKVGSIYLGTFPENKIIANSTTELGGTFWTMVSHLPSDSFERNTLFIHESFHRLQPELGLGNSGYENNHMDDLMARVLLKLEWSAVKTSIRDGSSECLWDALVFRYYRRSLYPGSDSMENRFEIHEGLAEYTGNKLCTHSMEELHEHLTNKHEAYWNKESLVRSFGYYSGFLYAFLLDREHIYWRQSIHASTDLGGILRDALNLEIPLDLRNAFDSIKNNYGYSEIYNSEMQLQSAKDSLKRKYVDQFLHRPVIKIQLFDPNIGFNVNAMQSLDSLGMVYEYLRLTDTWGRLEVSSEGCLLSPDWSSAIIPATQTHIDHNVIHGKTWDLFLNDEWELIQSEALIWTIRLK